MLFTKLVLSSSFDEKTAGRQRQKVLSTDRVEPPEPAARR
jgi:hypothetical protein